MIPTKRLHVITWGCQMNVYDSGRMADVLAPLGYGPASEPDGELLGEELVNRKGGII